MKSTLLILFSLLLVACQQRGPSEQAESVIDVDLETPEVFDSETHQAFFDNLKSLCGNTYAGQQVYRSHHGASWADYELVMHISECSDELIAIPFRVGEDRSRTWLFMAEGGQLRFRHDHRHEDGTPEDETLYGGYANDLGTAFVQHFPADDYTARLIDGGGGNLWTVTVSEDFSSFSYRLERDGEKRFRIDFDLSRPLNTD